MWWHGLGVLGPRVRGSGVTGGNGIPAGQRLAVKLRDGRRCVRCFCPVVHGHWHHRRTKRVVDEHRHCTCNGILLCKICHDWVHAHPLEARRLGWIVSRHVGEPGTVPVFTEQHGWVLLGCDSETIQHEVT